MRALPSLELTSDNLELILYFTFIQILSFLLISTIVSLSLSFSLSLSDLPQPNGFIGMILDHIRA